MKQATPAGIEIYSDIEQRTEVVPTPAVPRSEVVDEIYNAVFRDQAPLHDDKWGMATMEACLAILRSANEGSEVTLHHQVACP